MLTFSYPGNVNISRGWFAHEWVMIILWIWNLVPWNTLHEIYPMKILVVSWNFHSTCTFECAMKICDCIMKILWCSYWKTGQFWHTGEWSNFSTLVLEWVTGLNTSIPYHFYIHACPRNSLAPSNSNCVPSFICLCN